MAQKRLFVGLGFEDSFSQQVELWMKKLRKTADQKEISVKWTPKDNFHVTLVFLGPTQDEEIPDLSARLARVAARHADFALKIRQVGAFPHIDQARVLWLGVQRTQALLNLQSDLENELLSPDRMEGFGRPHLTVGRLRNSRGCRDLLSPFAHANFGRQPAKEIILYHSYQAGNFPAYEPVARFSLTGLRQDDVFDQDQNNPDDGTTRNHAGAQGLLVVDESAVTDAVLIRHLSAANPEDQSP